MPTQQQGPRAQIDRKLYKMNMQSILSNYANLDILSASVQDIVLETKPATATEAEQTRIVGLRISELVQSADSLRQY